MKYLLKYKYLEKISILLFKIGLLLKILWLDWIIRTNLFFITYS